MQNYILSILTENGINPNYKIGEQTAYEILEAAILGAIEQIEKSIEQ